MISNYYIIASAARQIAKECAGASFVRAFSLHSDELRIELSNACTIVAILKPAHCVLYLDKRSLPIPRKNIQYFFEELAGSEIQSVVIDSADKLVHIGFGDYILKLRFYNSPNAILFQDEKVVTTFKKETERSTQPKEEASSHTLQDKVNEQLPMLGKYLEKEFFARYSLQVDSTSFDVSKIEKDCAEYDTLLRSFSQSFTYIVAGKEILSPIELYHLSQKPERTFSDISEGIFHILRTRDQKDRLLQAKESLHNALVKRRAGIEKSIEEITKSLTDMSRAERHSAIGTALLAEAHTITNPQEKIKLDINGETRTVTLDLSKTIYQNAEAYFEKARTSKNAKKELEEKLPSLLRRKETLASYYSKLDIIKSPTDIESLKKEMVSKGLNIFANQDEREDLDPLSKFRKFILSGDYTVLVGKNAKQNDDLTLHVAKKEDMWFHARHVPGSHVVLQTSGRKEIPKEIIERTAEIAAYFSDAKTQKHAPVAYTRRKYVRKPKGSAPGAVIIEREEVVIVTPRIPENDE